MNRVMLSLYAYMAGGGSKVVLFLQKANFSLKQSNKFYLTIMVVVGVKTGGSRVGGPELCV